jgi:hypothetical protein
LVEVHVLKRVIFPVHIQVPAVDARQAIAAIATVLSIDTRKAVCAILSGCAVQAIPTGSAVCTWLAVQSIRTRLTIPAVRARCAVLSIGTRQAILTSRTRCAILTIGTRHAILAIRPHAVQRVDDIVAIQIFKRVLLSVHVQIPAVQPIWWGIALEIGHTLVEDLRCRESLPSLVGDAADIRGYITLVCTHLRLCVLFHGHEK